MPSLKYYFFAIVMTGMVTPAWAHSGDHGHLLQWLGHMFTSSDHLLALLGLTLVVGICASWRLVRRRRRASLER